MQGVYLCRYVTKTTNRRLQVWQAAAKRLLDSRGGKR